MKRIRFAAFSCPHCPLENPDSVEWAIKQVRQHKPNVVVCLGDLFEADAASRWDDEHHHDLADEYEHGSELLRRFRSAAPTGAQVVWMHGNHDDNIKRAGSLDKRVRRTVDWNRHADEFAKWEQVPYRKDANGLFTVGPVVFSHGFDYGRGSDRTEAVQASNLLGSWPNMLSVRGHTHRPVGPTQVAFTSSIPLPCWYANAGTLGPLKPDYMMRKDTSQWGAAIVLGDCAVGANVWKEKSWDAETVIK